jgi:hypothetical protein
MMPQQLAKLGGACGGAFRVSHLSPFAHLPCSTAT